MVPLESGISQRFVFITSLQSMQQPSSALWGDRLRNRKVTNLQVTWPNPSYDSLSQQKSYESPSHLTMLTKSERLEQNIHSSSYLLLWVLEFPVLMSLQQQLKNLFGNLFFHCFQGQCCHVLSNLGEWVKYVRFWTQETLLFVTDNCKSVLWWVSASHFLGLFVFFCSLAVGAGRREAWE